MTAAADKARADAYFSMLAVHAPALAIDRGLQNVTVWPWVITLRYTLDGQRQQSVHIVQSTAVSPPDELQFVPEGAENLAADVFPASRFDDMAIATRTNYAPQYRAFLMWRAAHAIGKKPGDMRPWVDYDPIGKDERVSSWLRPGRDLGD